MKNVKLNELKTLQKLQKYSWFKKDKELLYNSVVSNGYDIKKGKIKITYDNYIIDGHHRYYLLSKIHDGDYKVDVVKLPFNRSMYVGVLFLISIIFLPVLFVYYILLKIYYGYREVKIK
jgi:hypothetical protein